MNRSPQSQVWTALQEAFHRIAPEVDLNQIDPAWDLLEQAELDAGDVESVLEIIEDELGVPVTLSELEDASSLDGIVELLSSRAHRGP